MMSSLVRFCCVSALIFAASAERGVLAADGRQVTLRTASAAADVSTSGGSLIQTRQKTRRMMSRDPEQLEKWEDSGQAVKIDSARISPEALIQMSSGITGRAFGEELHNLCDPAPHKTRFVGTDGNVHMSQKIKNKFAAMGLDTRIDALQESAKVRQYVNENKSHLIGGNVIGILKGTDLAHEVVVVGAHYDSVNWDKRNEGATAVAPGVDDNGSGSALVQLVAKAMTSSGVRPRRSVMFVGWNAEEEGLVGSEQMAAKAKNGDYGNVKAVLVADEVAYPGIGDVPDRKAIFETVGDVPGASSLLDTFAHHAMLPSTASEPGTSSLAQINGFEFSTHGDGLRGFEVNKHGFGSDHMPFLTNQIPAMLLIERNNIAHNDAWGHSERDSFEHVDFDYGAAMTRLMLRAATALSSPALEAVHSVRNVARHWKKTQLGSDMSHDVSLHGSDVSQPIL